MDRSSTSHVSEATASTNSPGNAAIVKFVYDRKFLLQCRESFHSRRVPLDLPEIPGVTIGTTIRTSPPQQRYVGEDKRRMQHAMSDTRPSVFRFDEYIAPPGPPMPIPEWNGPNDSGPLAQYRRRQFTGRGSDDQYSPQEPIFYPPPPMHNGFQGPRGMQNPGPIIPPDSPFHPPPFLMMHPLQGPAGFIPDPNSLNNQMSKLSLWRKSHVRNEIPNVQSYVTAKTPQLNSSCSPTPVYPDRNRRYSVPEFRSPAPMSAPYCDPRVSLAELGYHTHHSINTAVPDDPSIIAYQPARQMAGDSCQMVSPLSISF